MVCIFDPACELLPPRKKYLFFTCVLLPLYCTISLTSFPLPPSQSTEYTDSVWQWGGGVGGCWNVLWTIFCRSFTLCFWPDFRTYKIATPPQTKMTSKDDIKGFVSLKFLRLWYGTSSTYCNATYGIVYWFITSSRQMQEPISNSQYFSPDHWYIPDNYIHY